MIQTTIQAALDHNVKGYCTDGLMSGHTLYLSRDGETVFYVGQSVDPLNRLRLHLGLTPSCFAYSSFGTFIIANAPGSHQWVYEMWKPLECLEYVVSYYTVVFPAIADMAIEAFKRKPDREMAEDALIHHFRPCLNVQGNRNPTPLPERYKRYL